MIARLRCWWQGHWENYVAHENYAIARCRRCLRLRVIR